MVTNDFNEMGLETLYIVNMFLDGEFTINDGKIIECKRKSSQPTGNQCEDGETAL